MPRGVGTVSKNGTKMPAHKKQSGGIRSFLVNSVHTNDRGVVHGCVYVPKNFMAGAVVYILVAADYDAVPAARRWRVDWIGHSCREE